MYLCCIITISERHLYRLVDSNTHLDSQRERVSGEGTMLLEFIEAVADTIGDSVDGPESAEGFEFPTDELQAQTAALDTQIQGMEAVSDINASVNESLTQLSEDKAFSFGGVRTTPFEDGITLSDSNVPHNTAKFNYTSDGLLEKDGNVYESTNSGVHELVGTTEEIEAAEEVNTTNES